MAREDIGLGAGGIGVLNIGTVIFTTSTLVIMGIQKSTSQKISENIVDCQLALKESKNGAFSILTISIVLGIALLIVSFCIGFPLSFQNSLSSMFFIIGLLMFLNWYRGGTQSVLSGIGDYDNIAKSNLCFFLSQLISGLLLMILIIVFNLPIALIFLAYAIGLISQVLLLNKYFKKLPMFHPETFQFNFRSHELSKNTRQGILFSISEIVPLNILGATALLVIFAFTKDFNISGAFSIVTGYSLAGLLVTNFTWPLITHIAEAYGKGDHEKINYNLKLVVKLFFYLTSLIIVVLIGLSQGFLYTFYGNAYLTGTINIWVPFMLMVVGSSIASFEYIICCVLLGVGKRKPAAAYLGTLFLLIIGFCSLFLWLNPFDAQINTALGYLTSTVVMVAFIPYLMKKEINEKIPFSIGIRSIFALLSALSIGVVLFWPPLNLIPITNFFLLVLSIIIIGAIYLFFLIFYGSVAMSDIEMFREKINEYVRLKRIVGPILTFLQKIMKISPFYKEENLIEEK